MQVEQRRAGQTSPKTDHSGLMILSVLPVLIITVVVLAVGGVGLGFLIPALVCGAMVGMLTFVTLREKTR